MHPFAAPLSGESDMNVVADVPPAIDILLDLSKTGLTPAELLEHIGSTLRNSELSPVVGIIHVALPPQVELAAGPSEYITRPQGAELLHVALEGAGGRRRPLLVLSGTLIADSALVALLLDALESDPLIGSAQPRFADDTTDLVYPIPNPSDPAGTAPLVPRAVLGCLPVGLITPELLAACLLLRHELAGAIHVPHDIANLSEALAFGLCQARRCGFRNVIVNRAVAPTRLPVAMVYPQPTSAAAARLAEVYPDATRAAVQTAALSQRRLEAMMGAAYPAGGGRRSLLVDCRGMGPFFNGTSVCVLGLLDGLVLTNGEWRIDILCSPEAAVFHDLAWRYPEFTLKHGEPVGNYAAALMPNQPFHVSHVANLHRHALVLVFTILDTIGWDVLYALDDHVAPTWRLIARHADGLAFISGFSEKRFEARFPISSSVIKEVAHLSLRIEELTLPDCRDLAESQHILIFGNNYDHKALAPTLRILSEAFPMQPIVVVGGQPNTNPLIQAVSSGELDAHEIHRLIATAKAIVYPSFYEGFGLPVVEGLAYGRPVIVRRSPLWEEIGGHARLPGRLVPFDDAMSLVTVVGRVLEGMPVEEIPMGLLLSSGEPAEGWRECAARLLRLLDRSLANACVERWMHRNEVLEG